MSSKETKKRISKLRKSLPKPEICSKCGKEIPPTYSPDTGPKTIDDKPVCNDCWVKAFGNEVEEHPLVSPRILNKLSKK